jgi:hypothetical protein
MENIKVKFLKIHLSFPAPFMPKRVIVTYYSYALPLKGIFRRIHKKKSHTD